MYKTALISDTGTKRKKRFQRKFSEEEKYPNAVKVLC